VSSISLADLTLVIPAYNRPAYLARQIEYWAGSGVQLCILDGSKNSADLEVISRMGPDVHYEYMPIGFNERLVHASKIVNTKYVALLGDDELYAKHGLRDCLDLLDTDKRLIGCVGRSLFFFHREGEIYGHQVYGKSQDIPEMHGEHLARLRNSFPQGDPSGAPYLLYGVFRKEQWCTMFGNAYARHYSSGYVYELALLIIGACLGPTKMVDSLVWLRSGENPAMSSTAVNRKIGTGEWGTSPEYASEYLDFVERITEVLSKLGVASEIEIEKAVRQVAEQFFAYSLHKPHRPIAYWHRVLGFAARKTPRSVKTLLKQNMTKTLGTVLDYKGVAFEEALLQLKIAGVAFSQEEMNELKSFLLRFHSSFEKN
jgi:glycosyltransferase domain-containing protein